MATRFGGASPTYAYSVKMRYIVGCLALIIIVLLATLVFVLQKQTDPVTVAADPQAFNAGPAPATNKMQVLVALQRIEEGTALDKSLFTYLPWDPEQLPENVVLWREADAMLPNRYSSRMIVANMPVTRDLITDTKPNTPLKIPPGFRAVTILVDARTGVEGWAKPNTRVDVLCTYVDPKDQKKKVATVVRFVKILSVSGTTQSGTEARAAVQGNTTVTLLVEERNAKKVELSRQLGELSLALVGDVEPSSVKDDPEIISITDIFQSGDVAPGRPMDEPSEGQIVMTDPKTGRPVTMLLRRGKWERADKQ